MNVDEALISKLEKLARLQLSEEEKTRITSDLSNILDMVAKMEELDTSKVEPLVYISEEVNVLREDVVQNQLDKATALKNAPEEDIDYFKVPKVIDL